MTSQIYTRTAPRHDRYFRISAKRSKIFSYLFGEKGRGGGCSSINISVISVKEPVESLSPVGPSLWFFLCLQNGYNWWPNLDGVFLDESPFDLLARGDVKDGPMMVGYNRDEGTLIVPSFYPDYVGKQEPPYIPRQSFDSVS